MRNQGKTQIQGLKSQASQQIEAMKMQGKSQSEALRGKSELIKALMIPAITSVLQPEPKSGE